MRLSDFKGRPCVFFVRAGASPDLISICAGYAPKGLSFCHDPIKRRSAYQLAKIPASSAVDKFVIGTLSYGEDCSSVLKHGVETKRAGFICVVPKATAALKNSIAAWKEKGKSIYLFDASVEFKENSYAVLAGFFEGSFTTVALDQEGKEIRSEGVEAQEVQQPVSTPKPEPKPEPKPKPATKPRAKPAPKPKAKAKAKAKAKLPPKVKATQPTKKLSIKERRRARKRTE